MNDFSLVVMDQILQQTRVSGSVVEGDQYTYDLSSLLVSAVAGQRYSWGYIITGCTYVSC